MRSFLGVTFDPTAPERVRRPSLQALACLCEDGAILKSLDEDERSWTAFAGAESDDVVGATGSAFTVRIGRSARTRERDVATADLPAMIAAGAPLAAIVPPFAAVHRAGPMAPITVAGDWLGFHQLYWWRGDGAVAVSTSARALAVLAGGGFDPVGVGAHAMIGWHVGDATLFSGVRVLPPATIATLDAGSIDIRRYAEQPPRPDKPPALDDAVEEMAEILRAWQTTYLNDHPDAVLQLTGGHDSRILLAAIPPAQRIGLHALTLDDPDSPDAAIATRLATPYRMQHIVHDLAVQTWPTPAEAHTLALTAARALECAASPLALFPLLLAEAQLDQGHRLSGLGGEVARGFYYAGQPAAATTSSQLVDRLANWRLFANEAVEAPALHPEFLAQARSTTLDRLQSYFAPGDWLRATDEFYLFHRMHRWAGSHGTVAATRRHYINPMFDRRFVELALAVAPADKRDSLLLGRLMRRLDPELARIPLDSGITPARLGTRSMATRLATNTLVIRKMARKTRQRLARARSPQLGAAESGVLVLQHWRAEPKSCQALYDATVDGKPVLRAEWLDGLLSGAHGCEPTTVAFLVDLLAAGSPDHDLG
jgi:asparagine synthase (glutamine-hydrolysing)